MNTEPRNRVTTWTLDEWQQPAGPVGGDFVITRWRKQYVRIFVGDVTGHGVEVAETAEGVRCMIDAHADDEQISSELLTQWSSEIGARFPDRFVCLTFAELDFNTNCLTVFNAGNPPLIIRRGRGHATETYRATGMPLGLVDPQSWAAPIFVQTALDPDDAVVCFTDGLPERIGAGREQFGLQRVLETIEQAGRGSPALCLSRRVALFADCSADQDDVTVLALRAKAA